MIRAARWQLAASSAAATLAAGWLGLQLMRAPLADLATARTEHRRYAQAASAAAPRPTALLAREDAIVAGDREAAVAALGASLAEAAHREGLLVESREPLPGAPGAPAEMLFAASGAEPALLRFVAAIESGSPPVRFRTWQIEGTSSGRALRLNGRAIAWWQSAATDPPSGGPIPRLQPPPALDAASARTLFANPSGAAAPAVGEARGDGPALVGVIGRIGQDAVALVRDPEGRSRSVAPGDMVDGWRLDAIGRDAVLFSRGGVTRRLELPGGDDTSEPDEATGEDQ